MGCPGDASNGGTCSINTDCKDTSFPLCDTSMNSGTCVQCTDGVRDCGGALCVKGKCQPCTQHSQCPSHACLGDGTCADAGQVAYVRPNGSGMACTDAAPCKTINDGLKAKSIVKVEGAIMDMMPTTIDGKAIQIVADPGSTMTRSMPGVILDVKSDKADVRVSDLEITGGTGQRIDAVVALSGPAGSNPKLTLTHVKIDGNQGTAILATSGTLSVSRSTISNNAGGGISITAAQFDITNNFIVGNGGALGAAATGLGGMAIGQIDDGTRRFDFNTVANNNAAMGLAAGINCLIGQTATFSNNIVFDNVSGAGKLEVGGNCAWTYSDIGEAGTTQVVTGTGNLNVDPSFATPGSDYHLKPDSPVKGKADPGATITVDVDGDPRPAGKADIGADEVPSP
jgi:hypothetical protein